MNGPDKPRKVALGLALDTPDEELDMAALITPADIEAAKADGARMTKRGRALLEAPRVETDAAAVGGQESAQAVGGQESAPPFVPSD